MRLFLNVMLLSQNLKTYLAYAHGANRGQLDNLDNDLKSRLLSSTYIWKIIGGDIDGDRGSKSGYGVSLNADGSRVAVGAVLGGGLFDNPNFWPVGEVKVFERDERDEWVQLGEDIRGEEIEELSGQSVSLSGSGNRVAVGAPDNDSFRGQVRVYDYVDGSWVQYGQDLIGEAIDKFGGKVRLSRDGMRLIVGAESADSINGISSGHARVFADVGGAWKQLGQDLDGEAPGNRAGSGIAISANGERVAVGAKLNSGGGQGIYYVHNGHTRVYELLNSTWVQIGEDINGEDLSANSGFDVDLNDDGTRIIIGERTGDTEVGTYSGQAKVFDEVDGAWVQVGGDIEAENRYDYFGWSVGISEDGNRVAIAAQKNDDGGENAGHVRVFDYINGDWVQIGQDLHGEDAGDFISRVALSADGSTVAFGAPGNEGGGSVVLYDDLYYYYDDDYYHSYLGGGHTRVFELVEQRCGDQPDCDRLAQLNPKQVRKVCRRNKVNTACPEKCGFCY